MLCRPNVVCRPNIVCGLTGMGEYFSQVTPRNGAKSIVVSFC